MSPAARMSPEDAIGDGDAERPIHVLLIDDHKLFAEAVQWALERVGITAVGVSDVSEVMGAIRREEPDLILLDIGLPSESGLSLGSRILEEFPTAKIVALTALNDPRAVTTAIRSGFFGYLTKDMPVSQLVSSVRAALDGQVVIPHQLAPAAAGMETEEEREAKLISEQLTGREREVLELLAEGASSQDIAARLSISPNTVRTHVQSILTKLQVRSRLEAVAFAVRYRFVNVPGDRRY